MNKLIKQLSETNIWMYDYELFAIKKWIMNYDYEYTFATTEFNTLESSLSTQEFKQSGWWVDIG
jgi:hypothetical protein